MKMTAKRSLAVLLAVIMLFSCIGIGGSAADKTGFETLRVNCTMYGDAQTQRGFTWYTEKKCDTTIQVVPASEYAVSGFANAMTVKGSVSEWNDYYCHKVVVTGLEPGTTYNYRVGSMTKNTWSTTGKFVTDNGDKKF